MRRATTNIIQTTAEAEQQSTQKYTEITAVQQKVTLRPAACYSILYVAPLYKQHHSKHHQKQQYKTISHAVLDYQLQKLIGVNLLGN